MVFVFKSAPVAISALLASPVPNLGCIRLREEPGNPLPCHSMGPEVPSHSASFSAPFRGFVCLFYLKYLGFVVVLSGQNREKYVYSFHFPRSGSQLPTFYIKLFKRSIILLVVVYVFAYSLNHGEALAECQALSTSRCWKAWDFRDFLLGQGEAIAWPLSPQARLLLDVSRPAAATLTLSQASPGSAGINRIIIRQGK